MTLGESPYAARLNHPKRCDQELLARIERIVPIEHKWTKIADQDYPWTQVRDPDRLLMRALSLEDAGTPELDPFWAATWRAAIGLEKFLDRYDLSGHRVLDLGCGSGRSGIGAALRGAIVTMTDLAGAAILVSRYNARFVESHVQCRRLDWTDETLSGDRFKWIIGSDIVYDPKLHPILEPCLRRHLAPGGRVLLSEPQRHTGDRFSKWIRSAGWKLQEHFLSLDDNNRDLRVFELTLQD
jgi:predicted nicotinamide N-methyase